MTYYDIAKSIFKEEAVEKPWKNEEYFFLKGGSYFIGCHQKLLQYSNNTLYYPAYLDLDEKGIVITVMSNGEPIEWLSNYYAIKNPTPTEFTDICHKILILIKQMCAKVKINELNHDFL